MVERTKAISLILAAIAVISAALMVSYGQDSLKSASVGSAKPTEAQMTEPEKTVRLFMEARIRRNEAGQLEQLSEAAKGKYDKDWRMYTANLSHLSVKSYHIDEVIMAGNIAEVAVTEVWAYKDDEDFRVDLKPTFKVRKASDKWVVEDWSWQ